MADNVTLQALALASPASGTIVATDDIGGGVQAQLVKLLNPADGSSAPISATAPLFVRLSDGSAAITTLAVSLASVPSHAVTNAGTFAVQATLPTVSRHRRVCTASTNAASVKASAGTLHGLIVSNPTDAPVFVKFHNTASSPTAGSTAVTDTFMVQATLTVPFVIPQGGLAFATGIGISVTGAYDDSDTTATSAGPIVEVFYA